MSTNRLGRHFVERTRSCVYCISSSIAYTKEETMTSQIANDSELLVDYVTPTADEAELARQSARPLQHASRQTHRINNS